jgi:hypothetical protein
MSKNSSESGVDEDVQMNEIENEELTSRTIYVTRSGLHGRINMDMFQDYDFLQFERHDWGNKQIQDEVKTKFSPYS